MLRGLLSSLTQEFIFLKMFTILKIQKELINMAKKLDTKSQKSHDYSPKNAQFLGKNSLCRLPKKSWHNHLKNNRGISRESESCTPQAMYNEN